MAVTSESSWVLGYPGTGVFRVLRALGFCWEMKKGTDPNFSVFLPKSSDRSSLSQDRVDDDVTAELDRVPCSARDDRLVLEIEPGSCRVDPDDHHAELRLAELVGGSADVEPGRLGCQLGQGQVDGLQVFRQRFDLAPGFDVRRNVPDESPACFRIRNAGCVARDGQRLADQGNDFCRKSFEDGRASNHLHLPATSRRVQRGFDSGKKLT